jgi:hypothetical protein
MRPAVFPRALCHVAGEQAGEMEAADEAAGAGDLWDAWCAFGQQGEALADATLAHVVERRDAERFLEAAQEMFAREMADARLRRPDR